MRIELNNVVPDFSASITGKEQAVKLSDYRGKNVVLYFYPKDSTPGCTLESQNFRDNYEKFTALNTVILGISRDSIRSHDGFKCKQRLQFELISDNDEVICQLFDVLKEKNMYGKQVIGIERSTFLINADGVLIYEWRKVKVDGHVEEVLEKVSAIV
ncbi:MAG: peroxiredoxin [Methylococcales bacterium]|nr:peroxiredoxin [Methylococcales bacterium]